MRSLKLILLGAPGAGKGTQAEIISEKYNIPAISTGAIIREAIQSGTEMGKNAKSYIDAGALVPDEVVIGIIRERLAKEDCVNGFILDGFPRTVPQAEALEAMGVEITEVLSIEVPDEKILTRMAGRRVCPKCGATFHTKYNPPKAEGICDTCGAALTIRADDNEETVKDRLAIYHAQTEPLKEFYSAKGLLVTVHGCDKVEDTTALVFKALKEA